MIARDVMTAEVRSVTGDATLRQIAQCLVQHGISGVPVIDGEGLPIGMVTESDLIAVEIKGERKPGREWWLTHLAEGEPLNPEFLASLDPSERTARDIMTRPAVTVAEAAELPEIARLFASHRIKRLPVVRGGVMVGIVSRADLIRQMASEPVLPQPVSAGNGLLAQAVASLDKHFAKPHAPPANPAIIVEPPEAMTITAKAFSTHVEEFGHQKTLRHEEERRVATETRAALVKDLLDHHVEDKNWQDLLRKAQAASEAGQKELLLLRFPCELCSDGGRAINAPLPEWPETLRGEAAEIYLHWERELKPNGFHLTAQILDFPGGIPGDAGLTLGWGE